MCLISVCILTGSVCKCVCVCVCVCVFVSVCVCVYLSVCLSHLCSQGSVCQRVDAPQRLDHEGGVAMAFHPALHTLSLQTQHTDVLREGTRTGDTEGTGGDRGTGGAGGGISIHFKQRQTPHDNTSTFCTDL